MKTSILLILIIGFANNRILHKKEVAHTRKVVPVSNSVNSNVRPPRKLYYVVESAKKPVVSLQKNKSKRELQEQKKPVPLPTLHLNKSFVVPRGHVERLRNLAEKTRQSNYVTAQNGKNRRLNAAHGDEHGHVEAHGGDHEAHGGGHEAHGGGHEAHGGGHGGHGDLEDLEHEDGHHKLQSTPLLLIGDYEIIVEKRDDI